MPGGGPSLSPCSSQSQSMWSGIGAYLDVVALPHAGAQRMQSSGQVGRTAALSKVVGDAAGKAQRSESATQTWTGQNGQVPGRAVLAPGEGTHGGMEGMRARADSYKEGNEDSKQSGSGWGGLVAGEGVGSP